MISKFLREQKRYTQKDLCSLLEFSEEKAVPVIKKLKEFGVLKAVKASDSQMGLTELIEEDVEVADVEVGENEYFYVLTFVGVITVANRVLKCYPKYLLSTNIPKDELKQIIKVLEKYNSKEQIVRMYNDSSDGKAFNLLAVILFLLNDYFENGAYTNTQDIIESNGSGEILWDRTINETFTLLSSNKPYYTDLQTKKRVVDHYDYIKRLHECVLSISSKELRDSDLLDLFDIASVELSDEVLGDFGDKDYILYRIEKELNIEFSTRKQLLLKALYAYVAHSSSLYEADCFTMFGTNSFNLVWENVCARVLDNQLDATLNALTSRLPVPLEDGYGGQNKLRDIIEKPLWSATGQRADSTLIPDIVTIQGKGKDARFFIFDAKYYNAVLDVGKVPKGQPGIESITKQYLYQLAYKQFTNDHKIAFVRNCFLLPTEMNEITAKGFASLAILDNLDLQQIQVRYLPAKMVYEHYLGNRILDIDKLAL
jgi:hypothetical protein